MKHIKGLQLQTTDYNLAELQITQDISYRQHAAEGQGDGETSKSTQRKEENYRPTHRTINNSATKPTDQNSYSTQTGTGRQNKRMHGPFIND